MHPENQDQPPSSSCDIDNDEVLDESSEVLDPLVCYSPHVIDRRPTYVTEVALTADRRVLAAAVATFSIEIYTVEDHAFRHTGSLTGHENIVTALSIGGTVNDPLFSSSEDGCVKEWDLNNLMEVHSYAMGHQAPLFSCCASSTQVVAGGRDVIHFWDRAGKHHLGAMHDIPDGDVTQVAFHPQRAGNILLTGDQGGSLNVADITKRREEDEGIVATLNTGHPVRKLGFFGRNNEYLWCLSDDHNITLWEMDEAMDEDSIRGAGPLATPTDYRGDLSKACNSAGVRDALGGDINYIIDIIYNVLVDRLYVVAGTGAGGAAVFMLLLPSPGSMTCRVNIGGIMQKGNGGHTEVVRSMVWPEAGNLCVTAGEDGKIIEWVPPLPELPGPDPAFQQGATTTTKTPGYLKPRHKKGKKKAQERSGRY